MGRGKVEKLVEQLVANHLEAHLTKLVHKSKKKAEREKAKLKEFLQLPLIRDEEIVDVEVVEPRAAEGENSNPSIKKTSFNG